MKIYDELTGAEIITPNTDLGYLYSGTRFVEHIDDKEVVMEKTVSKFAPDGLKQIIPGHDVYEDCLYYHTYTSEEKAAQLMPDIQSQVDANAAAIIELAAMLAGGE